MVEYGINAGNRWNADWARRKTWILVGVVWTLDVQEVVVDTLQFETLPGELDGWVSLQWHTFRILCIAQHQSVVVHTCNHRFFAVVGSFLIHDTGKCNHLVRSELHRLGLLRALKVPELVALFLHAFQEFLDGYIPIDIVGVRDKHAGDGGCIVAHLLANRLICECLLDFCAVEHQFLAQLHGELVDGAYGRYGEVDWFL